MARCDRRQHVEDSIIWNLIEFWETWHDVDCDETIEELSAKEQLLYRRRRRNLWFSMGGRGQLLNQQLHK